MLAAGEEGGLALLHVSKPSVLDESALDAILCSMLASDVLRLRQGVVWIVWKGESGKEVVSAGWCKAYRSECITAFAGSV